MQTLCRGSKSLKFLVTENTDTARYMLPGLFSATALTKKRVFFFFILVVHFSCLFCVYLREHQERVMTGNERKRDKLKKVSLQVRVSSARESSQGRWTQRWWAHPQLQTITALAQKPGKRMLEDLHRWSRSRRLMHPVLECHLGSFAAICSHQTVKVHHRSVQSSSAAAFSLFYCNRTISHSALSLLPAVLPGILSQTVPPRHFEVDSFLFFAIVIHTHTHICTDIHLYTHAHTHLTCRVWFCCLCVHGFRA